MRFFRLALILAVPGLAIAEAAAADQAAASDVPAVIAEPAGETTAGPLAPQDQQLDMLFAKLKRERKPEAARAIADQIRETMTLSGSATIDMLMASSSKALADKRYGAALDFVDQVTLLAPDFAEGWNRRATIHYLMGNFGKAMADTAHTLAIEPRHLGALSGLAGILEDSGRDVQALRAWEKYLSLYPADRDAQKEELDIINKLSGQRT